jgi:hypothetical protein
MRKVEVIMPIGSDPSFLEKQAAIKRGARRADCVVNFPNYDSANPSFSISDYIARVRAASAVLADLTGERPSCYYELGIAEAVGASTHLVASAGTDIHQSGVRSRTRFYRSLNELEEFTAQLLTNG